MSGALTGGRFVRSRAADLESIPLRQMGSDARRGGWRGPRWAASLRKAVAWVLGGIVGAAGLLAGLAVQVAALLGAIAGVIVAAALPVLAVAALVQGVSLLLRALGVA